MKINIRFAEEKDLNDIVEIFNQAIRNRRSTGYLNEFTVEGRRKWFFEHSKEKYPILIAEQNGKVVGWISIDPYRRGRDAFLKTVESSLFIHDDYKQKGIGNQLLQAMIENTKKLGYEMILTIILEGNIGSIKLLEKNNFEKWGFLPEIAEIDGKNLGHLYYGKKL